MLVIFSVALAADHGFLVQFSKRPSKSKHHFHILIGHFLIRGPVLL